MPTAMMLTATPDTTWSPRWLTQATPCSQDNTTVVPRASSSAMAVEPKATPAAPAAKAANSILPSSPMSMTPARSDSSPASAHRISGVETRSVEASRYRSASHPPGASFGARRNAWMAEVTQGAST
jgi:hypothetical protein